MKDKTIKVKLPKNTMPHGKMEIITKGKNIYLVIPLISASFKKMLEIIIKNDKHI